MKRFSIFPRDDYKQALRIKRFFIAFSSYVLICSLVILGYNLGFSPVPLRVLVFSQLGILACNILLYVIFRTGFNKRFKDPSLTLLQILIATFWLLEVLYYADSVRSAVLLDFLIIFILGLFRFGVREFLFLSFFTVAGYAAVIVLLYINRPESINYRVEILNLAILATVLPWFSLVGGYITRLRKKVARSLSEIKESERKYMELSIIDDLTQLYNSRHFYGQLGREIERSNRYEHPLTLLMLDLDRFKNFNDTYGHIEGDYVLSRVGHIIRGCLRESDSGYRYGGEEFTVMLPMTKAEDGVAIAKRIQEAMRRTPFAPAPGQEIFVTLSIGVSQYKPREDMRDFVRRVDRIMYQAKREGRDRICIG
ncbi:MAG TPA: diguanylate cyclase [Smithella sp.]|nr:diguanylate cyclase [Smithella sp.]